jgi:hypothetical protein
MLNIRTLPSVVIAARANPILVPTLGCTYLTLAGRAPPELGFAVTAVIAAAAAAAAVVVIVVVIQLDYNIKIQLDCDISKFN